MTPAVKVWRPNHGTASEVASFPSAFCPTLLLYSSPSVSLLCLSLSLSHAPNPPSTHTPQVCEWYSLASPPHPGAAQCLSLKQRAMEVTHPVTLTSFLSVILALWTFPDMSTPVPCLWEFCHICLAAFPDSFTLTTLRESGIAVSASGFCGQNCPEERKDLALSQRPHSPCTGLLSRLQTGLPLNAWVLWGLRRLH